MYYKRKFFQKSLQYRLRYIMIILLGHYDASLKTAIFQNLCKRKSAGREK